MQQMFACKLLHSVGRAHQPKLHNGAHRTSDVVRTVAASAVLIPADMTVLPLISGKIPHMKESSGRSLGGRIHDCTNIFSEYNAPKVIKSGYTVMVYPIKVNTQWNMTRLLHQSL